MQIQFKNNRQYNYSNYNYFQSQSAHRASTSRYSLSIVLTSPSSIVRHSWLFSSSSCLQLRRRPCDLLDHLRAIFCSASLPSFSAQLLRSAPARAPRDSDPRRRTAVGGHAIRVLRGRRRVRSRVHRGNHGLHDREGREGTGVSVLDAVGMAAKGLTKGEGV